MMIFYVQLSVVAIFCLFVFIDICSLSPRVAGSITRKNALGYTFNVILNTIKRIFVVSYPPLLGVIAIIGDFDDLFFTIFLSYFCSIVAVTISYILRRAIIAYFCALILRFDANGNLFDAFIYSFRSWKNWYPEARIRSDTKSKEIPIDGTIVLVASWIYLFYGSSMFIINIAAMQYDEYSEIIYQLFGLVNALGTLAMAFILDPKLSRIYERGENLGKTLNSLFLGHLINLLVLGPLLIAILAYLVRL